MDSKNMEPGRELDIEIGKRIIKVMVFLDSTDNNYKVVNPIIKRPGLLPFYSTNLEDAQMLVEYLQYNGYYCNLGSIIKDGNLTYRCSFTKQNIQREDSYGFSIPHAISLAALMLDGEI